jgi:hypothetical protein
MDALVRSECWSDALRLDGGRLRRESGVQKSPSEHICRCAADRHVFENLSVVPVNALQKRYSILEKKN